MIQKTREFNLLAGAKLPDDFTLPSKEVFKLQIELLKEELQELAEAYVENDKTECLDALIDIAYVLFGTINRFGAHKVIKEGFDRVHNSNMSKFCKTKGEADRTKEHYEGKNIPCKIHKQGSYFVVKSEIGKVLKSVDYTRVFLEDLI